MGSLAPARSALAGGSSYRMKLAKVTKVSIIPEISLSFEAGGQMRGKHIFDMYGRQWMIQLLAGVRKNL
jgi:hypothetical protein